MTFGDAEFLALFLPLAWLVHWLLPRRAALQNVWLLATSYVFFATWTPRLIASVVVSTLVLFALVRWVAASRAPEGVSAGAAQRAASRRRLALFIGVVFSLAQLAAFKYLGFFAESLNALLAAFGARASAPVLRFVLPVGLSFWTLQQIAYLTAAWAVTQTFFLVSLVPFRAGTLPAAGHFARGLSRRAATRRSTSATRRARFASRSP